VGRGRRATLVAQTAPSASCSIVVNHLSGPSTAQGLVPKAADSSGQVSWTWTVGTRTTLGTWPILVTCSIGEQTARLQTTFTVG
jgi:micrococcal nuclease